MASTLNYNELLQRVKNIKSAGVSIPETDPADKGKVSLPSDPEKTPANEDRPASEHNMSAEGEALTDKQLKPVSTGKNTVSTTDGAAKEDAATSPTTPISKIAKDTNSIIARLQELRKSAQEGGLPVTDDKNNIVPKVTVEKKKDADKVGKKESEKKANDEVASDIEITPEFHFKLASAILETEEGMRIAYDLLAKKAGQDQALHILKEASAAHTQYIQYGQYVEEQEKQAAYAEYVEAQTAQDMFKSASAEEQDFIVKAAAFHTKQLSTIEDEMCKAAYMQGAQDAAGMMGSEEGGAEKPEIPGASGEPSIEEIMQVLQELLQSGQITEEQATQIAQVLSEQHGGGEGGAPEGGAPPEGAMAPEGPEEKAAASLLDELVPITE